MYAFENIHGGETSVAVSPDNKYIFSASKFDKCIKVFDLQTGLEVYTYDAIADCTYKDLILI